jgi:hypothetical protein
VWLSLALRPLVAVHVLPVESTSVTVPSAKPPVM